VDHDDADHTAEADHGHSEACGEHSHCSGLSSGAVVGVTVACALASGALGALGLLLAQRRMASSASTSTPHSPRQISEHDRLHQCKDPIHSSEEVCKVYLSSSYSEGASGMEHATSADYSPPSVPTGQLQHERTLPAIDEQTNEVSAGTPNKSHLSPPFGVAPVRANGSSSSGGSGHRAGTSTKPSEVPFGGVQLPPGNVNDASLGAPQRSASSRSGSVRSMSRGAP
jgi:hypothetical protein